MSAPYPPPQTLIPKPRLMVVCDEPGLAAEVRELLGRAGYDEVIATGEPSEAMRIVVRKRPDLLLLAVTMSGTKGLDTLQEVRSSDRFRDLPVIMLTASTDREIKIRALELGVTDFLHNPIDPLEFPPRIRNAISIKALWQHYNKSTDERTKGRRAGPQSADKGVAVEAQTDGGRRPKPLEELSRSQLSWPVLQETHFQELKSKAKVMIVDDEPINTQVVCRHLSSEGYRNFVTTTDATEALDLIRREDPDVVLLDIMMPRVSGLEILTAVRADEELMDLPVIILTASTDQATKRNALDLGATEFLTKPFDPTEVLPRVRNAVVVKAHQDRVKDYVCELEREVSRYVVKVKEHSGALERANEVLRRSRSAAQAANRAKSQFLANMSHEIRTPLTTVIGCTEMMLEGPDSDRLSDQDVSYLDTIVRNGKHLLEVVDDLLELSKIEAGQLEIEVLPCSPHRILAEVLERMRPRADRRGLLLEAESATPVPEFVHTDPTCLRRILISLVGNALKFTEEGSVRVIMSLLGGNEARAGLQFEVVDTGIGMNREQMEGVFQPFVQADASAKRRFGGTGLGLAISRQLAEKLGGGISVRSELGRGSSFRVVVSVGSLDKVRMIEDPFSQEAAEERPGGRDDQARLKKLDCRILLAEDSADIRRLVSLILRNAGAEVVAVDNGRIAYEQAKESQEPRTPFDVILMDMQMPVMDGYTATARLREAGYHRPIIALTAHAMAGDREKCLAAGCDDFITKPVSRERLLAMVARHVSQPAGLESVSIEPRGDSGRLDG